MRTGSWNGRPTRANGSLGLRPSLKDEKENNKYENPKDGACRKATSKMKRTLLLLRPKSDEVFGKTEKAVSGSRR